MPLKLTKETNEEYLPIGTTFESFDINGGPGVKHTIIKWEETEDGQTIKFTPELPADTYLTNRLGHTASYTQYALGLGQQIIANVPDGDWQGFYRGFGSVTVDGPYFTKRNYYGIDGMIDISGSTQQYFTVVGFDPTPPNAPVYDYADVYGPGDDTIRLEGRNQTVAARKKLFRRFHDLDWNNCWVFGNGVESDRIRDDFNAPQMDNGVKASSVLAEPIR
jgi:hypothetical protein